MHKLLFILSLTLIPYSAHASVATATRLVNAGNFAGALDEIGRIPPSQWQQKKTIVIRYH